MSNESRFLVSRKGLINRRVDPCGFGRPRCDGHATHKALRVSGVCGAECVIANGQAFVDAIVMHVGWGE